MALYGAIYAAQPVCMEMLIKGGSKLSPATAWKTISSNMTKTQGNVDHINLAMSMYESLLLASELKLAIGSKVAKRSKRPGL